MKIYQGIVLLVALTLTGCTTKEILPQSAAQNSSTSKNWKESALGMQLAGTWQCADENYVLRPNNQAEFTIGKPAADGSATFAFTDKNGQPSDQGMMILAQESPALRQITVLFHDSQYNGFRQRTLTLTGDGNRLQVEAVICNIPLLQYWIRK